VDDADVEVVDEHQDAGSVVVAADADAQGDGSGLVDAVGAGDVVGVAHPVVVRFRAPVANRSAAERTIDITSTPRGDGQVRMARRLCRAMDSGPILAGAQRGVAIGGRPVNGFRNGLEGRRCRRHLGPHVHREHRRRRRESGTAPPPPGIAGLAVPAAQGHAVEESDTAIAAVPAGSTFGAAGA
jgi:hypothetical protein